MYQLWNEKVLKVIRNGWSRKGVQAAGLLWDATVKAALLFPQPTGTRSAGPEAALAVGGKFLPCCRYPEHLSSPWAEDSDSLCDYRGLSAPTCSQMGELEWTPVLGQTDIACLRRTQPNACEIPDKHTNMNLPKEKQWYIHVEGHYAT